jgi:hypothetical protein
MRQMNGRRTLVLAGLTHVAGLNRADNYGDTSPRGGGGIGTDN